MKVADTSSPRATLKTFIEACNELDRIIRSDKHLDRYSTMHHPLIERILDCLDVSEMPEFAREDVSGEVAVSLKEILDRVELPPLEEIPDIEAIDKAGGPEKLSRWQIPGTRVTIARVDEGPRRHEYLFSSGTTGRARGYYKDIKSMPYRTDGPAVSAGFYNWYMSAPGDRAMGALVERLPNFFREPIYGQAAWKWIGLAISLVCGVVLIMGTYRLYGILSRRFRENGNQLGYCLTIVFPIVAAIIPWGVEYVAHRYLTLRSAPMYVVSFTADLAALLGCLIVMGGVSNRIASVIIASPRINPQGLDAQMIRITSKLMTLVVCVVVFLEGGSYLGFPITSLLAATGIGGLAVALGAQDTLKTLFGTIMLMADKPFRVGERIVFGKYDGTVEDIGLRSTKIRLLTGHQAIIPNDELARNDVENVGRRPHIRRVANIRIPLDTPLGKLEKAVEVIRETIAKSESMDPEFPSRVYFNEFNSDSFNIRVIYWHAEPHYWDFLAQSEKINFAICHAFEEQGIQFSLPMRIAHTSIDSQEKPVEVKMVTGQGNEKGTAGSEQ